MAGFPGGQARARGSALAEWRAHWSVILPSAAGIMLCSAHAHVLGVMIRPLEQEFGWPRAQISAGMLVIAVVAAFVSPLVGLAIDRFGPRRIALCGIPVFCGAMAMLALANGSILSWWGLWVLLALGNMLILPVVWLSVINGYFHHSRGLAMAVALTGTGFGAAIYPVLANALLEANGWRGAYVAMGAILAVLSFPLAWLLFHPAAPASAAAAPHGASPAAAPRHEVRAVMASARFLKLAGAAVVFAVASCALTGNAVPVLIGEGLTPAKAAATAGLLGIGSIAGRLCGGLLLDRFDGNKVAAFSVILPVAPAAILLLTDHSPGWSALAFLLMGLSVGTELDACAYLAARHFGTRHFGTLFGTINGLLLFGNGLAPLISNHVYDVTHSYDLVLGALIPMFAITAILFLTLGRYPDWGENGEAQAPAGTGRAAAIAGE